MVDFESQSVSALLALAGRKAGIDPGRCRLAFVHLGAADRVRCALRHALARHRLSALQFAILVLLFEIDPEPISMAVLARHTGVSRSAVTDAFDILETSGLAERARDRRDRRIIHALITGAGREKLDRAIDDYLRAAVHATPTVEGMGPAP